MENKLKSRDGDSVMHENSDIFTDPNSKWAQQRGRPGATHYRNGKPMRYSIEGRRNGIKLKVIIEPEGEGIITAFPLK